MLSTRRRLHTLSQDNKTTAINKLMEFIDQVRAQNGRRITVDAAQIFVADAQYVIGTRR